MQTEEHRVFEVVRTLLNGTNASSNAQQRLTLSLETAAARGLRDERTDCWLHFKLNAAW